MSASGVGRKFQFIREIASGGFGSVYLAKVIHGDGFARICAVKLLHPKWSENVEIASRMRDEARLLGWLRHKNLVEVLDLTRIGGRVAVIMEYLEAVDVKAIIGDGLARAEAIPVRVCLEICAAVASALDAAYNRPPYAGEKPLRVIHRDIKPSNIMLDTTGTVKVLDFGVARADFAERESKTQELSFGSIEYMPPERLFFEPDTPQGDVYSLGVTLYELLSLDKFGKAKLRAEQMEAFFEDRWAELRARRAFPGADIEGEVHLLLKDMLAFDTDNRATAADCVNRMRIIARRCQEESLSEWSESVVPPIFQAQSARVGGLTPDSLVNQTLAEDSRGFGRDEETQDVSTAQPPPAFLNPDRDEEEDSLDESGRLSDEQWKKVKEATLNDLEKPKATPIPPRTAVAPPRVPAGRPQPAPPPQAVEAPAKAPEPPSRPVPRPAPKPQAADPAPAEEAPKAPPPKPPPIEAPVARKKDDVPPPIRSSIKAMSQPDPDELVDDPPTVGAFPEKPPPPPPPPPPPTPPLKVPEPPAKPAPAPTAVFAPSDLRKDEEASPKREKSKKAASSKKAAPPTEVVEEEEASGSSIGLIIGMIVVLVVLVGGAIVIVAGVGAGAAAVVVTQQGTTGPEAPIPDEKPVEAPKPKEQPKIVGPVAKFTSEAPDTKKVSVRCSKGEGSGTLDAEVAVDGAGECTITAVDEKRKRYTAVVKDVKAQNYVCFTDGSKDCK